MAERKQEFIVNEPHEVDKGGLKCKAVRIIADNGHHAFITAREWVLDSLALGSADLVVYIDPRYDADECLQELRSDLDERAKHFQNGNARPV